MYNAQARHNKTDSDILCDSVYVCVCVHLLRCLQRRSLCKASLIVAFLLHFYESDGSVMVKVEPKGCKGQVERQRLGT